MSILRYTASLDNTITNAFEENLTTRGTGSNMGASDILEVFSIYGQASSASVELSRVLIKFPLSQATSDRALGVLPGSGSVNWKLKLYNAPHFHTVPTSYDLTVSGISGSWQEGTGLDMEDYSDLTNDEIGSNWINANNAFASASATIKIIGNNPSAIDDGSPPSITLISTDGTERIYAFQNGGSFANAATASINPDNWDGKTIRWYGVGSTATTQGGIAALLKTAIESTNGHNGKLIVSLSTDSNTNDTLTIKQAKTGFGGNSLITLTNGNASDLTINGAITALSFSGGYGQWAAEGGDYYTDSSSSFTQSFDTGLENLELDVTTLVEQWINSTGNEEVLGSKVNDGFSIRLSNSFETAEKSYYTKKFYGRGTEFFFKRPVLEAQFEDSKRDDRGNFHISSSLLPAADNLNCLYFYNKFRGRLVDIAGSTAARPVLKLYHSSGSVPEGSPKGFLNQAGTAVTALSASRVDTGIYKVQIAVTSSIVSDNYPFLVDVWSSGSEEVFTGSVITPKTYRPELYEESTDFVLSMTNLKPEYGRDDLAKLRLYAREKNWSPNIYTVAKSKPENKLIISGSYKVIRMIDDLTVVDYGTGSLKYTELSYDQNGNYFEFNMDMLEPGYQYGFKFSIYDDYTKSYLEQPHVFKFRVS